MLAPHVVRMSGRDRTRSWAIAFHPWWIGTLVSLGLTAAYLALSSADLADGGWSPSPRALLCWSSGPMSFIFQNRSPDQPRTVITSGISVAGVAALVAMVAVNFALVSGRHLG